MSAMASQITSVSIVYSIVWSDPDQRKHQSSVSLAFVTGIHRLPVNSPHKRDSNAENASIWWRHHGYLFLAGIRTVEARDNDDNISSIIVISMTKSILHECTVVHNLGLRWKWFNKQWLDVTRQQSVVCDNVVVLWQSLSLQLFKKCQRWSRTLTLLCWQLSGLWFVSRIKNRTQELMTWYGYIMNIKWMHLDIV